MDKPLQGKGGLFCPVSGPEFLAGYLLTLALRGTTKGQAGRGCPRQHGQQKTWFAVSQAEEQELPDSVQEPASAARAFLQSRQVLNNEIKTVCYKGIKRYAFSRLWPA